MNAMSKTLREFRRETLRAFLSADSDKVTEDDLISVTSHSTQDDSDDDDESTCDEDEEYSAAYYCSEQSSDYDDNDDDDQHNKHSKSLSMTVVQSALESVSLNSTDPSETSSESFPLCADSVWGGSCSHDDSLMTNTTASATVSLSSIKEEKAPLVARLTSEDRQALWLIWSTMQIHADDVQQLEDEGIMGRRMLKKLYDWNPQRLRECLQCPPEGRGGVLAEMARHILSIRMGILANNILREMARNDVADVARALVSGMQLFLAEVLPQTTSEHHRSTSPRDWSLLARAWTEAMQECHPDTFWSPAIHEAWCRVMTLLLRSIYKELWYKDSDDLNEKIMAKCGGGDAAAAAGAHNNNGTTQRKVVVRRA